MAGLASVAGRLGPAEAARVRYQLDQVTYLAPLDGENAEVAQQAGLVKGAAGRLGPAEAARVAGRAARLLSQALEKEPDASARQALAAGLASVAQRLEPAEAARVCSSAVKTLRAAKSVGEGTARLIQGLDPAYATQVATQLATDLCSTSSASRSDRLLDALLTNASRPEVSRRGAAAAATAGVADSGPFAALPALPAAAEPLPCRLSTQELVDFLKMPTCYGEARKIVLKHLGNRYGRTFANHWEFVRFAQEQHLDLDFTTPPKRPPP
jgi:hypothetical protein